MRVTMIGAGYVGLVSGACFAEFGHHVTCVDKDPRRVAALKRGEIPIFEPGLSELVAAMSGRAGSVLGDLAARRRLRCGFHRGRHARAPGRRPRRSELCLPGGARDRAAAVHDRVVVTKSTVPVGTGDEIEHILREQRPDAPTCRSYPIRNSCAKAPPSRISCIPTASWSAPTTTARARCSPNSTGRSTQRGADPLCQSPHRRADQIRVQRVPRHQDHVHQRDGGSVREVSARTSMKWPAAWASITASARIPERRSGLWRVLLPERHHRAAQDRARSWLVPAHRGNCRRGQRTSQARDGA